MWLRVESVVLEGLDRSATFLVAVPYSPNCAPRAWGFWNRLDGPSWIGRRHTNFPDGSICAFVPGTGLWQEGGSLVSLIDFYSVWALRQVYLEMFGRWPGRQFSPHPFYSLVEFKSDELCCCDAHDPPLTYGECCRPKHLATDLVALKSDFERTIKHGINDRIPPASLVYHVVDGGFLPDVSEVVKPTAANRG